MDITLSIKQSEVFKEVAQTTSYTVTKVIAVGKPKTSVFAKAADKLDSFFSSVLKLAGIIMLLYGLLWTAVKTDYINRLIQWIRKLWK